MIPLPGLVLLGVHAVAASVPALKLEPVILLHVDVLGVRQGETATLFSGTLELTPGSPENLSTEVPFGNAQGQLKLEASGSAGVGAQPHRISVKTRFRFQGTQASASRDLEIRETSTYLVEAFEMNGQRLVVALKAESATRPVAVTGEEVSAPLLFRLEVERVEGKRFIPLETNRLQTFVGKDVEYSFRRGRGDHEESVHLRLQPVRIHGDLAELVVEITASLPGDPDRLLLSRRESLFTTRHATSKIVIATGEPPTGYRFLITPEF